MKIGNGVVGAFAAGAAVYLKACVALFKTYAHGVESVGVVLFHGHFHDVGKVRRCAQRVKVAHHKIRRDLFGQALINLAKN